MLVLLLPQRLRYDREKAVRPLFTDERGFLSFDFLFP